jgi:4-hydroxybenzoate polyprenyltransferase
VATCDAARSAGAAGAGAGAVQPIAARVSAADAASPTPLVVDLDGTVLRTDTLYESLVAMLRRSPLHAAALPFWLLGGRARLKREIARRGPVDPRSLPYRDDVLDYLRTEVERGRKLVLATASDALVAEPIALHLGLFDAVLASDGNRNLKGSAKADALRQHLDGQPFAYAGNDWADMPVWEAASSAVVVSSDRGLASQVERVTPIERHIAPAGAGGPAIVRALRLGQWVKNLLVFVPLLAAHRATELPLLANAGLAFVAFGLVASAGYLVNDLMDIEADRQHERKRLRPFASGALPLRTGLVSVPLLVLGGLLLGLLLAPGVALALAVYLAASLAYTFYLKRIALVDVFVLAMLYASRIVAGAIAVAVPISQWLLAFSIFFFLGLAFVKRYSELHALRVRELDQAAGRGYVVADFPMLSSLGAASGYISVLVLALYINSPEVIELYGTPDALWLVCLVLLYWISRVWVIVNRGHMDEDPIVFALKDRTSYLAGAVCAAAFMAAWLA